MNDDTTCTWRCGDAEPGHGHYAVLVRESGQLLGRLTPRGGASRNRIYAAVLSRARADAITADINGRPDDLTAKTVPF